MSHRIIFFGTSELAVPSLRALLDDPRIEVVGVVTQPDRPAGREGTLTAPAIKQFLAASRPDLHMEQPEKLNDPAFKTWIETAGKDCDAFVVIAYGKILPQWLLDIPPHGIINIHPSLLPRWRGPSPIQSAIAAGDPETGVTIMRIDAEMDHGPLLAQFREPIQDTDTAETLHDRLAEVGAHALPDTLVGYIEGRITPTEQDHAHAVVCKLLSRDDGRVDLNADAPELIVRKIRAYTPWPGVWTMHQDKRLKIIAAHVENEKLVLDRVQPEGKTAMTGDEYLRGLRA